MEHTIVRPLHRHVRIRETGAADQLDLFRREARILPLNTRLSPFEAALLLDQRGSERAEAAYREAIETGDNIADCCCNLGVLMAERGLLDEAVEYLNRSLEQDPEHVESHFNLANLYLEKGWAVPAEVHYRIVISVEPAFAGAYYNLAIACILQKKTAPAIHALHRFLLYATRKEAAKAERLLNYLKNPS